MGQRKYCPVNLSQWIVLPSNTARPVAHGQGVLEPIPLSFAGVAQVGDPPVIWLSPKGSPVQAPVKGEATLTPEQAQQFSAGSGDDLIQFFLDSCLRHGLFGAEKRRKWSVCRVFGGRTSG